MIVSCLKHGPMSHDFSRMWWACTHHCPAMITDEEIRRGTEIRLVQVIRQ